MESIKLSVYGTVQGVGFRYHTQIEATKLGLNGYVKNLPDGTVEILAMGNSEAIAALKQWAAQGSPAAQVTQVVQQQVPPADLAELSGFTIKR
ncbi:MAG: acylphosphatase [Cyanobacteria bacterium P01_D01_bin.128]